MYLQWNPLNVIIRLMLCYQFPSIPKWSH
jgi:hypothetical protein